MAHDRYALLGLGQARSAWFGNVALWATSGAIPVDFAKCVSVAELRQRLAGLQPYSALVVEATTAGLDRDLIDSAARVGVPAIVVDTQATRTDEWLALGAVAVLPPSLSRGDLIYALHTHATVISRTVEPDAIAAVDELAAWTGNLVAVCGPGGTGASSAAIAIAQGLGDNPFQSGLVALVDFALNAEQAMLHDARDVVPGIEELVDAQRNRATTTDEVRSLVFAVQQRGYDLLLGVRRPNAWVSMPPRAVNEAITSLRRSYRTVVADITADFEGEDNGGSIDIEERNCLARSTALAADVVVVVGAPGMKGCHSLARTIRNVIKLGVNAERIIPVVNRAPKSGTQRSELSKSLSNLVVGTLASSGPIFVPERNIDDALRDGVRLPKPIPEQLASCVTAVLNRSAPRTFAGIGEPKAISPGSLGLITQADSKRAVGE